MLATQLRRAPTLRSAVPRGFAARRECYSTSAAAMRAAIDRAGHALRGCASAPDACGDERPYPVLATRFVDSNQVTRLHNTLCTNFPHSNLGLIRHDAKLSNFNELRTKSVTGSRVRFPPAPPPRRNLDDSRARNRLRNPSHRFPTVRGRSWFATMKSADRLRPTDSRETLSPKSHLSPRIWAGL